MGRQILYTTNSAYGLTVSPLYDLQVETSALETATQARVRTIVGVASSTLIQNPRFLKSATWCFSGETPWCTCGGTLATSRIKNPWSNNVGTLLHLGKAPCANKSLLELNLQNVRFLVCGSGACCLKVHMIRNTHSKHLKLNLILAYDREARLKKISRCGWNSTDEH